MGVILKTKIIYISGSEIFNMADVRSAFDTVRQNLGLANDTILFGVPVDTEDALAGQFESAKPVPSDAVALDTEASVTIPQEIVPTPIMNDITLESEVEKVEKPKRKTVKKVREEPIVTEEKNEEKPVIPILSVLGSDDVTATDIPEPLDDSDETITEEIQSEQVMDDDIDFLKDDIIDTPLLHTEPNNFDAADMDDEIPTVKPEITTIQDAVDDDDDSLEKLLQSVQSLHEDKEESPKAELKIVENDFDETDATLEKLANEFVENQDKIVNTTKSTARGGKIGKLKNILPFKKAKHNESSLMGDLFGWAGVAANDEEFAIPEFFPTAAKK